MEKVFCAKLRANPLRLDCPGYRSLLSEYATIMKRGAPLAQLDRASGYEPEGREFESLRARHKIDSNGLANWGCSDAHEPSD
jgi:hypothetical protein